MKLFKYLQVHVELIYHTLDEEVSHAADTLNTTSMASMPLTSLEKVITSNTNGLRHTTLRSYMREGAIIRGILQVTVIRAENLIPSDSNHLCDPYVLLRMKKNDARKTTKVRNVFLCRI